MDIQKPRRIIETRPDVVVVPPIRVPEVEPRVAPEVAPERPVEVPA